MNPEPDVFVLGDLNLLRAVGRAGLRAALHTRTPWAARSRFCSQTIDITPAEIDPQACARDLCSLGSTIRSRPVLYYSNDAQLLMVSRHREDLLKHFRFLLPSHQLVEDLVDKSRFQLLAMQSGFLVPRTVVPTEGEEQGLEYPWEYPALIKPVSRVGWFESRAKGEAPHKAFKVDNADELHRRVQELKAKGHAFIVQEFIPGGDDEIFSFHTFLDRDANPLAWFVGRKIRTYPAATGRSSCVELVHEPEVAELGRSLLEDLDFQGIAKVDFKRDARSGRFYLLEINARFNLWHYLGAVSGVNLPAVAHRYLNDLSTGAVPPYKPGLRWIEIPLDVRAARSAQQSGRFSLWKWLRPYFGKKVFNLFAWNDPRPALFAIRQRFSRKKPVADHTLEATKRPHAVVIGLDETGLGMVRALSRVGVPVVGIYTDARQAGRSSRHCRALRFPDPRSNPGAFVEELQALGARLGDRPVLFPTADSHVVLLSREREALGRVFRFHLPHPTVLDNMMDKSAVIEAAHRWAVPTPRTFALSDCVQGDRITVNPPFPCVAKYRRPWEHAETGRPKATVLTNAQELRRFAEDRGERRNNYVLQEFIRGDDSDHAFCLLYVDSAGQVSGVATGRAIHRFPPNLGVTASCVTHEIPELVEASERLLVGEGYMGLAELEFKRDRRDGAYKLYEINARTWAYNALGPACGVNFVELAYLDAIGERWSGERLRGRPGQAWMNSTFEMVFCLRKLRRLRVPNLPWRALLPGTARALFSWDDPRPALTRGFPRRAQKP